MEKVARNHTDRKHKTEVHIHGILCENPQLRPTKSGKTYCRTMVETQHEQYREYIRICAWGDVAGHLSAFRKGDYVQVVGRLHTNKYTNVKGEAGYGNPTRPLAHF